MENKIYNKNILLNKIKKLKDDVDLVEINSNLKPPLVKIINFNKFIYEQKKKYKKNIKKKNIKIIRLSPNISEHDIDIKLKQILNFLKKKYKVKLYVFFKGRSIIYKEKGNIILNRCFEILSKYSEIEKYPYREQNKIFMVLKPKKN
ncbi:MAG: translation initiation factor IF-3 [Candidatus Shikimatogenerans sp. JK-2022]|nr:translation initiation factor IF-3 [Candidatus Shikimatogenerans bostrichidophilus]